MAAERCEPLPPGVDGEGHACGLPAAGIRDSRAEWRLGSRRRCDRSAHLARRGPRHQPAHLPVDPTRRVAWGGHA